MECRVQWSSAAVNFDDSCPGTFVATQSDPNHLLTFRADAGPPTIEARLIKIWSMTQLETWMFLVGVTLMTAGGIMWAAS